ncbi:LysR family transcriptional regulator [Luminiphilus syltensis]|nr:LysR family transcriptional regulator [Luminiphilus syltensis]
MSRITLESLEVLDAIDRKGSFSAAAASLYRVPSKITYTVNKLQDDLGVTLFVREGRRSVLTPAGKLLLEQGRELLDAADRLVEKTKQLERGWESRLRIALDTVLDSDFLLPHLQAFCDEQPDTEVDIASEVLGGTWEALQLDRADLVVAAAEASPESAGVESRPIMTIPWVFAVAPHHPLAEQAAPVSEDVRLQHRAIVVRDSSREHPAVTLRVFERQPRMTVSSMADKIAVQRAGLGAGFLPRPRVERLLDTGELVEVPLQEPIPDSLLFIAWRRRDRGRALKWFIERLSVGHAPVD